MSDVTGAGAAINGAEQLAGTIYAADQQSATADKAIETQKTQFNVGQQNQMPWLQTGGGALGKLNTLYGINPSAPVGQAGSQGSTGAAQAAYDANQGQPTGNFKNAAGGGSSVDPNASFYLSPDYNFRMEQGLKGLNAAGAAGNGTDSGALRKAEIGYAGNLASGEYTNYKNGLMALAGLGQTTATNTAQQGQANANAQGYLGMQQGNNLASAYQGIGTAAGKLTSGLGSYFGNSGQADYQNFQPINASSGMSVQPTTGANF